MSEEKRMNGFSVDKAIQDTSKNGDKVIRLDTVTQQGHMLADLRKDADGNSPLINLTPELYCQAENSIKKGFFDALLKEGDAKRKASGQPSILNDFRGKMLHSLEQVASSDGFIGHTFKKDEAKIRDAITDTEYLGDGSAGSLILDNVMSGLIMGYEQLEIRPELIRQLWQEQPFLNAMNTKVAGAGHIQNVIFRFIKKRAEQVPVESPFSQVDQTASADVGLITVAKHWIASSMTKNELHDQYIMSASGINILSELYDADMRSRLQAMNDIIAIGGFGVERGILNIPYTVDTPVNTHTMTKSFNTPAEQLDAINELAQTVTSFFLKASNNNEPNPAYVPDTMVIPTSIRKKAENILLSSAGFPLGTFTQQLKTQLPFIKNVFYSGVNDDLGAGGAEQIAFYRNDPQNQSLINSDLNVVSVSAISHGKQEIQNYWSTCGIFNIIYSGTSYITLKA